jgi:hypothetical protein
LIEAQAHPKLFELFDIPLPPSFDQGFLNHIPCRDDCDGGLSGVWGL